jgi:antitoxin MazE
VSGLALKTTLRRIGNSQGVMIPKPLLAQVGLAVDSEAEMSIEAGAILLRPVRNVRAGWAEDARRVAAAGDDALVLGEFGNDDDKTLTW